MIGGGWTPLTGARGDEQFAWPFETRVGFEAPECTLDLVPHGWALLFWYTVEHLVQRPERLAFELHAVGRRRQSEGRPRGVPMIRLSLAQRADISG